MIPSLLTAVAEEDKAAQRRQAAALEQQRRHAIQSLSVGSRFLTRADGENSVELASRVHASASGKMVRLCPCTRPQWPLTPSRFAVQPLSCLQSRNNVVGAMNGAASLLAGV